MIIATDIEEAFLDEYNEDDPCQNHGLWSYAVSLLHSSTLPMEKYKPLLEELECGVTYGRVKHIITMLKQNQQETLNQQLARTIRTND